MVWAIFGPNSVDLDRYERGAGIAVPDHMFHILAVEPDPERGRHLTRFVRERVDADVVLARSTDDAIAKMSERVPDVILTSALLTPHDDSRLAAHLKASPHARDLPVLTIPPVVDPEELAQRARGRVSPFRRRGTPPWPAYDPEALGARIADALQASRSAQASSAFRLENPAPSRLQAAWHTPLGPNDGSTDPAEHEERLLDRCGLGIKRLRAHRFTRNDLPWLSSVALPWGLEVQLLNISSSGLLIQSGSKFDPGSVATFHLSGSNRQLVVPARIVRTQVGTVDIRGVKFLSAAVFEKDLDLLTQRPAQFPRSVPVPTALAHLLSGVVAELEQGKEAAVLRATFEQGLRRMVGAREIELRGGPAALNDGGESISFSVPTDGRAETILQATFEQSYQPQEEEFRILKAAATLAGFLLQFADIAPNRPELVLPPPDSAVNSW